MIQGSKGQEDRFPRQLHVGLLEGVDLNLYPANKTHYLAYALQYGLELPSVKTMKRCENRNQKKSGAEKAQQVTGRIAVVRRKRAFVLPDKYGPKRDHAAQLLGRRMNRRQGAARVKYDKTPVYRKGRVYPPRPAISLPQEVQRVIKPSTATKERIGYFVIRSPESIRLKAERNKFREQIEQYRKTWKAPEKSAIPEYFRKKKARQHDRRKEKHELIKCNRKALEDIFGDAIYRRGWPISRKEIKLALGLKEEEHEQQTFLNEFVQMVGKSSSKDEHIGIHLPKAEGEVSRMLRISKPRQPESVESAQRVAVNRPELRPSQAQYNPSDDDFPSLFSHSNTGIAKSNKKR